VKHRLLSSIDKAQKLLDYNPQTKFDYGLEKVYRWFVDNWENIEKTAADISKPIYALDDESALKVVDDEIEVISEGNWFVINEKE